MRRVYFVFLSALLVLLFIIIMWKDANREWVGYQHQFLGTLAKDERGSVQRGIQQTLVAGLNRVDRCTTCHVAIEKPQIALGEEPFIEHPGDYLKWHPVDKFGCTVCHGGQGLATEVDAAHGDVLHWEEPLLRGRLVQASCVKCHGNLEQIKEFAPQLVKGKELFKVKGCYGCHTINDFGQTVSQDLTEIGSKSHLLMEADFEMMSYPHNRITWLRRKLEHPRTLNPGVRSEDLPLGEEEVFPSAMPNFSLADDEVEALTTYLLGMTGDDFPVSYVIPASPVVPQSYASSVERGRAVFERYGCAGCHGQGGVGGRRSFNAGLGEEVPSLMYVKAYYKNDIEQLKEILRHGRQPAPRLNPLKPRPSLYMPSWKDRISEKDMDALIAYLFSLASRLPQQSSSAVSAPVNSSAN